MEYKFNDENYETEVIKSDIPVLMDVFATWCMPCKMMAPIIKELAEKYDGRIKIGKADIDECPKIQSTHKIMSVPTLIIFKDGEKVETIVGAVSKNELESKIEQVLA